MNDLKKNIVQWIKDWFDENGDETTKAVIGISGGKDSSVVAALCCEALGRERVLGVLMPCGEQTDISDSYNLISHLGIESIVVNIESSYEALLSSIETCEIISNPLVKGNLQARLRMSTLYAIAQERKGRVSNNCNASERFVGYFTLYGDDAGDFSPLSNLTVREVVELGKQLGLPEDLYNKTPIDGLANNQVGEHVLTDEEAMGFTYDQLEEFMKNGFLEDKKISDLIEEKHLYSEFKRKKPRIPNFNKLVDEHFDLM